MQKNKVFCARSLALSGVCAALSVVLGKLLQIPIGNSIRISFENLPILLASLQLGPVFGGCVGVVADLIGCAVMGYTVNPFITLGAALVGILPALFAKKLKSGAVFVPILLTHIVASMLVKSFGLYLYYQTPPAVLALRVPIYLATACLESVIVRALLRSPAFAARKGKSHDLR